MDKFPKLNSMSSNKNNFPESNHVCLVYDNEDQRRKIVAGYLAEGISNGQIVRYFRDTSSVQLIQSWLRDSDQSLLKKEEDGSFEIIGVEEAYFPSGSFIPEERIKKMLERYQFAAEKGYKGSRACGEMNWVLRDVPGAERFLEYEALINTIDTKFPHTGMCQYDARLFDGATLFKILKVHPYIISQGQIVQNPYYTKPEIFIESLRK